MDLPHFTKGIGVGVLSIFQNDRMSKFFPSKGKVIMREEDIGVTSINIYLYFWEWLSIKQKLKCIYVFLKTFLVFFRNRNQYNV